MVNVGYVQRVYNNCLAKTCQFLSNQGFAVTYRNAEFRKVGQDLVVTLAEPLYFREWPYRSGAKPTEKLDILAEIMETIRLSDGHCVRSTLRLNYFQIDGQTRNACEAIHYDFNAIVQERHPVCHAQNSNSIIGTPEAFPADVQTGLLEHRHQAIRIPTAFVNLAGLFAKLTADHLPADKVSEFWATCEPYIDVIPGHARNDTLDMILDGTSLRSHLWYKWKSDDAE